MNKSEEYLSSIKSRMGWQLGLQTATLFAIGNMNSSIKSECNIIANEVKRLNDNTTNGLENIQFAVQSLETSLIYGIEELKWILGSIDDNLKVLIGLIQFPKTTESNELYLMGYELYKTEYYKESLVHFGKAVKVSPLNLNARIGLYLSDLKITKKPNIESLFEIAKLTNSNFYIHKDVNQEVMDSSIAFFTNFVSSQLCFFNEFEKWIELYETTIPSVAKADLINKIRYLEALINQRGNYMALLSELIDEGYLGTILLGINYKETEEFEKFIENCFNLSKEKLNIHNLLIESNNYLSVHQVFNNFFKFITTKEGIFTLGKLKANIAFKNNFIQSVYLLNKNIDNNYFSLKETEKSLSNDIISIESIKIDNVSDENDEFLTDSFNLIKENYHNIINDYKANETKKIKSQKKQTKLLIKDFENGSPNLEKKDEDIFRILNMYFSIDSNEKNTRLNYDKGLEDMVSLTKFSLSESKNEDVSKNDDSDEWNCVFCNNSFCLEEEEIKELNENGKIDVKCPTCNKINTCEYDDED